MIHLLIVERHATYEGPALEVIGIAAGVLGGLVVVGMLVLLVVAIAVGEEQGRQRRHDVVSAWQDSTTRTDVRTRLGEPTFTTRIKVGARSAPCDVFNAYDTIVDAWVQFIFCYDRRGLRTASRIRSSRTTTSLTYGRTTSRP